MTPMMEQYRSVKAKYPDTILFFRLGDFYEMFFDDALTASKLLQITLTARNKGDHKAPMCGIPYHAADSYIAKLTRLGHKVAICEQLSDPNLPGIVERDVIRVITPGTTLDENILDQKSNNYLLALNFLDSGFSLCYADITTGEFKKTYAGGSGDLFTEIERITPAEIILPGNIIDEKIISDLKTKHPSICFFAYNGVESDPEKMLLDYLKSTQKTEVTHLQKIQTYDMADFMPLDEATLKNLELTSSLRENKKEGSLLWVLDKTVTSTGGRMLRNFLTHPLTKKQEIDNRLCAVDELFQNQKLLRLLREKMETLLDMERITARISLNRGNARDLLALKNSLQLIPSIRDAIKICTSELMTCMHRDLDPLSEICDLIEASIASDPPLTVTDGGMIADSYSTELDEIRAVMREGKSFIQNLQQEEIKKTGINNLKVRYNSVFGYYIEVSKGNTKSVPDYFIRKQTLVNAERYITPELKEFEEKVLSAEEKVVAIEQKLFLEICKKIIAVTARIQQSAKILAVLDTLSALAAVALENNYCKPEVNEDGLISIKSGRHPVVEKMTFSGYFIPNDLEIKENGERLLLITGPNMGGKSTYLRQNALIVLMAQIGSFVPAESATVGIVDRIFTRVGASDNLVRGQSTFMVEMQETANILHNATNKSLVILDEIGRGTSTYDGMSIAWAVMEYLHDKTACKTLFATHYHELIALADRLPGSANYSVAVRENSSKEDGSKGITFLYKVIRGGVDRSYGIEVAKLAGLPSSVIGRANTILTDLEEGILENGIKNEIKNTRANTDKNQMQIFDESTNRKHAAIKELTDLDLNNLTPLDALKKLDKLKNQLINPDAGN
jgi:DNA mismatch repair protein MutS